MTVLQTFNWLNSIFLKYGFLNLMQSECGKKLNALNVLTAAESWWLIAMVALWVLQTDHLFEGMSSAKAYLAICVGWWIAVYEVCVWLWWVGVCVCVCVCVIIHAHFFNFLYSWLNTSLKHSLEPGLSIRGTNNTFQLVPRRSTEAEKGTNLVISPKKGLKRICMEWVSVKSKLAHI